MGRALALGTGRVMLSEWCLSCAHRQVGFYHGLDGFSVEEIAGDCLHPSHGQLGTEYLADLLVQWTLAGGRAVADEPIAAAVPLRASSRRRSLPEPLFRAQWGHAEGETAACYTLRDQAARSTSPLHGEVSLPWKTTSCEATILATAPLRRPALRTLPQLLEACERLHERPLQLDVASAGESRGSAMSARRAAAGAQTVKEQCPKRLDSTPKGNEEARLPTGWVFCEHDEVSGKPSPGVSAFRPGATMLLSLPTGWLPTARHATAGVTAGVAFNVTLQYLASWHAMGVASVACHGACVCAPHAPIDALSWSAVRNSSIFRERRLVVHWQGTRAPHGYANASHQHGHPTGSAEGSRAHTPPECILSIRVDERTASGAGHRNRFKIRDVVLSTHASPCKVKAIRDMLQTRSGLHCGGVV